MAKVVWMFPGPGAHLAGTLGPLVDQDSAGWSTLRTIDAVSTDHGWGPVSPLLLGSGTNDVEQHAGHPWLGFFATSLVLSDLLTGSGVRCDALVGHSGGEMSALVVAGCITVEDGARVLCERTKAVDASGLPPGGMVAVGAPVARVIHLCAATDDSSLAVAADNGPQQVVVSGLSRGLDLLERSCAALGIKVTRLWIPAAYHNPILAEAARRLAERIRDVPVRNPLRRLYSPILGRDLVTADDAKELLSATLVLPVGFRDSLRRLYDDGARVFLECGARATLSDLVPQCVSAAGGAVALLPGRAQATSVRQVISGLATDHPAPWPVVSALTTSPTHAVIAADPEPATPSAVAHPAPEPSPAGRMNGLPAERQLRDEVRLAYAEALRFPPEVVDDDIELEADLGVSSLKQTQVFVKLLNTYDLPTPTESVRLTTYRTVAQVAKLLRELAATR